MHVDGKKGAFACFCVIALVYSFYVSFFVSTIYLKAVRDFDIFYSGWDLVRCFYPNSSLC